MSSKQPFHIDSIIKLNVGGQRFETTLKTLLADRNSELFPIFAVFLEKDVTGSRLPIKDHDGCYFLDRDPDQFRSHLNNLRYLVDFQDRRKSMESLAMDKEFTKSVGFWGRFRKQT